VVFQTKYQPDLWRDAAVVGCRNGHEAVGKLLLEKAAELESKDNVWVQTPLRIALSWSPGTKMWRTEYMWHLQTLSSIRYPCPVVLLAATLPPRMER
jgi:hypothetical protein